MHARLVVHGVGNHPPGELLADAAAALSNDYREPEWREFNWSQIPGVVEGLTLSLENIRRMAEGIASAARLGTASNLMALIAEFCFGLALTLPVLSPILTGLLLLIQTSGFRRALNIQMVAIELLLGCAALAAMVYLLRALATAAIRRDAAPIAEFTRWAVLLGFRPIVLVCLLPFAPFLWEILSWGGEARKAFTWITVTGLFAAAFGWLWGEPFAVMGNIAIAAIIIAGLCLTWFAGQLVYSLFGPTLKVLLDVSRYLGDPELRANLHRAFDKTIADLPATPNNSREITIYAHSLGSVIAADSLLHSKGWIRSDSVELVTFGSPLRRLIMRFFPAALFPRRIQRLEAQISERLKDFRWINFFRPLDYIGGSLGLSDAHAGQDIRSISWTKSHSGYFADGEMWQAATAALAEPRDAKLHHAGPPPSELLPAPTSTPCLRATAGLIQKSGFLLAPITAALFIVSTIASGGRIQSRPGPSVRNTLVASGVIVPAIVTHWQVEVPGDPPSEIDHFRFHVGDRGDREIEVDRGETVFEGYNALFSVGGLRDAVRSDCDLAFKPALLQQKIRVPCRSRRAIEIRYLPSDPEHFDIPGFPPHTSVLRRGFDWFRLMSVGIVWCLVGGGMNTWLAGGWARLLFGVRG